MALLCSSVPLSLSLRCCWVCSTSQSSRGSRSRWTTRRRSTIQTRTRSKRQSQETPPPQVGLRRVDLQISNFSAKRDYEKRRMPWISETITRMPIVALFYGLNDTTTARKFSVKLSEAASETQRQDGGQQETTRRVRGLRGAGPDLNLYLARSIFFSVLA